MIPPINFGRMKELLAIKVPAMFQNFGNKSYLIIAKFWNKLIESERKPNLALARE